MEPLIQDHHYLEERVANSEIWANKALLHGSSIAATARDAQTAQRKVHMSGSHPVYMSTDDKAPKHGRTEVQNSRRPMRVGLLLDDQLAPRWINNTIERLLYAEFVELAVVVIGKPHARRLRPRSILFKLWRKFDKWTFSDDDDSLATELGTYPVQTITLTPVNGGNGTLPHSDAAQLRECNLDVLVHLGSGDLSDGFLSYAKYGIWAFQYPGYTEAGSELALFWNLYAGCSTYELVLRAEMRDQHCGRVLYRCIFPSHLFSLHRNLTLDCRRRAQILLQRLSDLYSRGWASIVTEDAGSDTVGRRIDCASLSRVMPWFIASWFVRALRHLFARLWFREQWILAHCQTCSPTDIEQTKLDRLTVVVPPRGQNYADPFLFEHTGKTYIFFEEFADHGPGTICCAELHGDGTLGDIQRVLTRNYHLSYPFVFEWHGDIYLLPETWDNKTVEVYGAVDFPQRWELAGVLLRNVTAVDPTIWQHNGKLWLFVAGIGGLGTELSELSLFFSDSLFGEWHPHPKNPVVRDARSARPAGGLFFQRDLLIRPAQDCSGRYGHAISFNKVEVLSETDYSEVTLSTILPDWMPRVCATHTFNQQGGFRVLDGQMLVPRWVPIERNLRAFLDGSRFRSVTGRQPTQVLTRSKPALVETPSVPLVSGRRPKS
jgi:hypothetical protein